MNKSLLLRVADEIERHPEQFDMDDWNCGSVACIGGWAERLSSQDSQDMDEFLNLVDLDRNDMERLCYLSHWPEALRERYESSKGDTTAAARIAADYIREFVRSHENSG